MNSQEKPLTNNVSSQFQNVGLVNQFEKQPQQYLVHPTNNVIKQKIIKELKSNQKGLIIINLLGFLIFVSGLIFNLVWIFENHLNINTSLPEEIKSFFVFTPLFAIPFFVFGSILFIWWLVLIVKFFQEKRIHYKNENQIDITRVPNFILSRYKNITSITIFTNWLNIVSLIIGGLALTYFILTSQKSELSLFNSIEITLSNNGKFPDYKQYIIFTSIYLGTLTLVNIIFNILVGIKKNYLLNLFDLKRKFGHEELNGYKKKVNIFCAIIFLIPFVILFLIYRFGKKIIKKAP